MKEDLTLKDLSQYYGTEQYHKIPMFKTKLTDGIMYIAKNGYSWFITDFLAVAEHKLTGEEFLTVELKIKDETAKMIVTNGNEKTLYTQNYDYTDGKKEFKLFLTDGVLMYSGEY